MEIKPRIICLLRLLEKYTDEEHQLTTTELSHMLESEWCWAKLSYSTFSGFW